MNHIIAILPSIHYKYSDGRYALVLRVYFKRKVVKTIRIGQKIKRNFWDEKSRQVKKNHPNASLINELINKNVLELEERLLKAEIESPLETKERIVSVIDGTEEYYNPRIFVNFCYENIYKRYSESQQKRTINRVIRICKKIDEFHPDLKFSELNYQFLTSFKAHLRDDLSLSNNTIYGTFKQMNTMLNDALKMGIVRENPMKSFDKGKYIQPKRRFITLKECEAIEKICKTQISGTMQQIGYYFLLMCYTGLRFSDAMKFDYSSNVINDERIVLKTEKSKTEVNILIHKRLKKVLSFIKKNPLRISNKEFNLQIKVIGVIANIGFPLTAHIGRHSFGAALATELNVPLDRAQRLLGHKNRRTTSIYYRLNNEALDKEMEK